MDRGPHEWVEVRIASGIDAGELVGALQDEAITGAWQEDGMVHLYWRAEQWTSDCEPLVAAMAAALSGDAAPIITVERVPETDWNAMWAKAITPIRVGRRFVIRPSWASVERRDHDIELIIDPRQAFGTGHHATTQLILEWLEDHIHGGEKVLDIGTGSGILAMAAIRLGASYAHGVDHDPVAIECAREYARENQFGEELRLTVGTVKVAEGCHEVILANLDRGTLLELAPFFQEHAAPHAVLLCSGILTEDRESVIQRLQANGWIIQEERERSGWLALAFRYGGEPPNWYRRA